VKLKRGFLCENPYFLGGHGIPLVLLLVFYLVQRKREKIKTDKRYARFLKAPGKARGGLKKAAAYLRRNDIVKLYDAVFKTLQDYLGNKMNLPVGSVTAPDVEKMLVDGGHDPEIIKIVKDVFAMCDMARYASFAGKKEEAEETLEKVRKLIDYLENKVKL